MKHPDLFHSSKENRAKLGLMTVRVDFDGGNGCNDPKNYGVGYGSFSINGGQPVRCDHGQPMSNNAAEIYTLCSAVEVAARMFDPAVTSLKIVGDSRIALKWADVAGGNRPSKISGKTSALFRASIERLCSVVKPFADVRTVWRPRIHSVKQFGH